MRAIFVSDLHTHPFPIFPTNARGVNGYMAAVEKLLTSTIPFFVRETEATHVVFLGDMAEEPYRRGKIRIAVQNLLRRGLRAIVDSGARALILAGNHDQVTTVTTDGWATNWLGALEQDGVDIVSAPVPENGLWLIPHGPACVVAEWLRERVPEGAIVCGHFAYEGTAFPSEGSVPIALAERFKQSILGHYHSPMESPGIVYPGVPIPYSFETQHAGALLFADLDNGYEPKWITLTDGPQFLGPVTLDELATCSTQPHAFVRLLIEPGDTSAIEAAKARYPDMRIFTVVNEPEQPRPRLELPPPTNRESMRPLLRGYVEAQGEAGDEADALLKVGEELL